MKRPAFQFYPADWRNNAKLRRCSWGARGVWIEILGLLTDCDEYGIIRCSLKQLARAISSPLARAQELATIGVLKGCDNGVCDAYVFVPTHAGRDGDPVTLVPSQEGPLWYSSRLVRDEYIRRRRAADAGHDRQPALPFGGQPIPGFGTSPKVSIGLTRTHTRAHIRAGPSSSSSSKNKVNTMSTASTGRFDEFWAAWPKSKRKVDRKDCELKWHKKGLDAKADEIIAHIVAMKRCDKWREDASGQSYEPAPLTYLNRERWRDPLPPDLLSDPAEQKRRVAM